MLWLQQQKINSKENEKSNVYHTQNASSFTSYKTICYEKAHYVFNDSVNEQEAQGPHRSSSHIGPILKHLLYKYEFDPFHWA
jgi:hypothetical protein